MAGKDETRSNIILISYADENYAPAQKLLTDSAKRVGFRKIIEYGPKDIDKKFVEEHEDIFSYKRGNGLWLWKPYLIKKTLNVVNEGDIIFYCDSGICFFRSPEPVFDIMKTQDIWVTVLPLIEKQFTKSAAFEKMGLTAPEYTDTPQISGTFIALKKTQFTVEFVQEWLDYCCDIDILSPVEDKTAEIAEFYDHREDQSVLSLLAKKYGIKPFSDPSLYGRLPEKYIRDGCEMRYYGKEDYRPFILHHRTKNGDKKVLLNQWLCAVLPRDLGLKFIRK